VNKFSSQLLQLSVVVASPGFGVSLLCLEFTNFGAMAAASMSMAVATVRLVGVSARAEAALSCNGAAVSLAAPGAGFSAMSCAFSEFAAVKRTGVNVARAAEVFGDLATEEVEKEVEEEEEEVSVDPPSGPQQGTKLYVGNLPWTCDSAELAELCLDVGTVEAVEVIYDQETGRSRGFAFVTMASMEDAEAVIKALNGAQVGGRELRVSYPQSNRDKSRLEGRAAFGERRSPRADDPNKLFVGNLSWDCDDNALHKLFSDYGDVVEAKVVKDRDTGRSRGFGFVTLSGPTEVNAAKAKLDGADFDGRQLRVNLAGEKPQPRQY
jgi:nucleolin